MAHLKGMEEIVKYARRSESTVQDWARNLKFPARQIGKSNIWESDTELIDEWRKDQILNGDTVERPEIKKTVKRGRKKK